MYSGGICEESSVPVTSTHWKRDTEAEEEKEEEEGLFRG
jgi:hypothetical protein